MTQTNEPRGPSGANRSRAMLIAVALMLAAISIGYLTFVRWRIRLKAA